MSWRAYIWLVGWVPLKSLLSTTSQEESTASSEGSPSRGWSYFSKEELQQILQERNELKTSLFLVQEELAYYQRSVGWA